MAKTLIGILGLQDRESEYISFVEDRHFNDLRYTIDCHKLKELGWVEEKTWEEGLRETVQWYQRYTSRYHDIEEALKAHPRAGLGSR